MAPALPFANISKSPQLTTVALFCCGTDSDIRLEWQSVASGKIQPAHACAWPQWVKKGLVQSLNITNGAANYPMFDP